MNWRRGVRVGVDDSRNHTGIDPRYRYASVLEGVTVP